jgi:hypothetical protein
MVGGITGGITAAIAVTVVVATAPTPASTTTTTTAPTASSSEASTVIPEPILLVVLTALLPVVIVAGLVGTILALEELLGALAIGLELSLPDEIGLLLAILPLGHDLEIVVLPLGCRVQGYELLCFILVGKCYEDGSLEEILLCATKLEAADVTKLREEGFKVELCVGFLVAEALDVDGSGLRLGLAGGHGLVCILPLDRLFSLLAIDDEEIAIAKGGDNGAVGLESAHSLERVDLLDSNGLVLSTFALLPHELILGEIPVAKVELDLVIEKKKISRLSRESSGPPPDESSVRIYLLANSHRIISNLPNRRVELAVVSLVVVVNLALGLQYVCGLALLRLRVGRLLVLGGFILARRLRGLGLGLL